MEFNNLIEASARRAITANQIDFAKSRYRDLIRVGFMGGLFEATDTMVSIMTTKIDRDNGWGMIVMDIREHPIGMNSDEARKLYGLLVEANSAAGRAYLMEYKAIKNSTKAELIKGE